MNQVLQSVSDAPHVCYSSPAKWHGLEEVRTVYRDAEAVGNFTVFNIKSYRLIVSIDYESQTVYYKYFLTHADYDKGVWKDDPYF